MGLSNKVNKSVMIKNDNSTTTNVCQEMEMELKTNIGFTNTQTRNQS